MTSTLASVVAIIIVLAVAALGVAVAVFPTDANRLRMRLPLQLDSPDEYIRAIGTVFAVMAIVFAVVIGALARWW